MNNKHLDYELLLDAKLKRGLSSPIARPQTDMEMLAEFKARVKNG